MGLSRVARFVLAWQHAKIGFAKMENSRSEMSVETSVEMSVASVEMNVER
jgi:hypothetical protein